MEENLASSAWQQLYSPTSNCIGIVIMEGGIVSSSVISPKREQKIGSLKHFLLQKFSSLGPLAEIFLRAKFVYLKQNQYFCLYYANWYMVNFIKSNIERFLQRKVLGIIAELHAHNILQKGHVMLYYRKILSTF